MGLFSSSSKSKSTTNTTTNYNDSSSKVSSTVGDLSKNNLIAGGDAVMYGYTADDTKSLIDTALSYIDKATEGIKDTTSAAISQVSSAYSGANQSILESQNATKAFLNSLKPYAFYAMVAAVVYFIFNGNKGIKRK